MNGTAVRTRGLTKRYGDLRAVDRIDLEVPEGEVYGFLGANGSGKTTTVRMLLGLVLPTEGTAEVLGHPLPAERAAVLPQVGALVEGPAAYPHLSGPTNLALLEASGAQRLRGPARRGRIAEVLAEVGLDPADSRPVRAYSLGMRQRLGLAGALLRRPRLLVLDEPTNGLDPQGIQEIRELLRRLHRDGTTIFLSSHLLAEVEQLCTAVGVLDRGRLVLQDRLDRLLDGGGLVAVRSPDLVGLVSLLGSDVASVDGARVLVRTEDPAALNAYLVGQGVAVRELTPVRPDLEALVLAASSTGAGAGTR